MIDWNNFSLLTAAFNRHDYTQTMLVSFAENFKFIPNTYIIDNSTINPCKPFGARQIHLIDNTNFKHTPDYAQPSKNHSASIEWALYNVLKTRYVILCDNDIIFLPNSYNTFAKILDANAVGEIGYDIVPPKRLFPYFCIFDLEYIKTNNIHFFDERRCMVDNATMDTGCSFLQDLKASNAKITDIKLNDNIIHLKGGTLHNKH